MNFLRSHGLFLFLLAASAFALFTCVRVDILNEKAGFLLPRTEEGKWRVPIEKNYEKMWRGLNQVPVDRDLNASEKRSLEKASERWDAEGKLRSGVGKGTLLYVLIPVILLLSVIGWVNFGAGIRWRFLCPALIVIYCGYRVVALSYFSSLGW